MIVLWLTLVLIRSLMSSNHMSVTARICKVIGLGCVTLWALLYKRYEYLPFGGALVLLRISITRFFVLWRIRFRLYYRAQSVTKDWQIVAVTKKSRNYWSLRVPVPFLYDSVLSSKGSHLKLLLFYHLMWRLGLSLSSASNGLFLLRNEAIMRS